MYLPLLDFTRSKQASPSPPHWKGAKELATPSPPLLLVPLRAPLGRQLWPHEKSESQMLSQNRDIAVREAALFLETLTVALRNR